MMPESIKVRTHEATNRGDISPGHLPCWEHTMRQVAGTYFCHRDMSHEFKSSWIHATCCGAKILSPRQDFAWCIRGDSSLQHVPPIFRLVCPNLNAFYGLVVSKPLHGVLICVWNFGVRNEYTLTPSKWSFAWLLTRPNIYKIQVYHRLKYTQLNHSRWCPNRQVLLATEI